MSQNIPTDPVEEAIIAAEAAIDQWRESPCSVVVVELMQDVLAALADAKPKADANFKFKPDKFGSFYSNKKRAERGESAVSLHPDYLTPGNEYFDSAADVIADILHSVDKNESTPCGENGALVLKRAENNWRAER